MVTQIPDRYWLIARDKPALLVVMMRELAGNSHISFEGNLTNCSFPAELSPGPEETAVLRRATLTPRQHFVVLPLLPDRVKLIQNIVLDKARFMKEVIHIQIERDGVLQFGAYDQFHRDCIVGFPPSVLPIYSIG